MTKGTEMKYHQGNRLVILLWVIIQVSNPGNGNSLYLLSDAYCVIYTSPSPPHTPLHTHSYTHARNTCAVDL